MIPKEYWVDNSGYNSSKYLHSADITFINPVEINILVIGGYSKTTSILLTFSCGDITGNIETSHQITR